MKGLLSELPRSGASSCIFFYFWGKLLYYEKINLQFPQKASVWPWTTFSGHGFEASSWAYAAWEVHCLHPPFLLISALIPGCWQLDIMTLLWTRTAIWLPNEYYWLHRSMNKDDWPLLWCFLYTATTSGSWTALGCCDYCIFEEYTKVLYA